MMRDAERRRDDAERNAVIGGAGVMVMLVSLTFYPHDNGGAVAWLCLLLLLQRDLMRACRAFKIHDDLITCAANLRRFSRDPRLAGTEIGEGLKELVNILGAA